jgi:hypothetical protein
MRHGRWRSAAVMRGYVEGGSIWNDNAAARLGCSPLRRQRHPDTTIATRRPGQRGGPRRTHGALGGPRPGWWLGHGVVRGWERSTGLVLNCITLWNTVYLDAALARLRDEGYPVRDEDVVRLSPYVRRHLNVHGHYSFQLPDLVGTRRALRDPDSSDDEGGLIR